MIAKRLTAVFLGLVMAVVILPFHAYARYANAESIKSNMVINGTLATCEGNVTGFSGTSKVSITISLQKQNTDGGFTTIQTWDKETANASSLTVRKSYYVESKSTYRTCVVAEVTLDGTTEKVTKYSGAVKCG